jgi:uncharacterized RDD family membrane protein YckC
MERSVEVATGESVAFSYELAGLGSRFLAVFVDTAIQVAVLFAVLGLLVLAGVSLPSGPAAKLSPSLAKLADAVFLAMLVLGAFLLFFGYFIAFETLWNGRTPGKRMIGIRVVRDGGFPVDFTSALVRNVVRIVEAGLGFYAISAVSALLSPHNRRLGDFAAGTLVVRDRFEPSLRAALPDLRDSTDPLVRDLGLRERDLVRRYVARRASLAGASRNDLAARIASVIRPQLPARFDHLDDDELLQHVAGALS